MRSTSQRRGSTWPWLRGGADQIADQSYDVFWYESPDLATRLTLIHKGAGPVAVPESSRTNADDRLPLASLGLVEGGNGVVKSRYGANVRPQPSVT